MAFVLELRDFNIVNFQCPRMVKAFFSLQLYVLFFVGFHSPAQAQTQAAVKRGGKWFFIDKAGTIVSQKLYDSVGERFADGLVPVMLNKSWGYANNTGKLVIKNSYQQAHTFHKGKALVKKQGNWLMIDTKGKTISKIAEEVTAIENMQEGIALAETKNGPAYILPSGKILRPGKEFADFQPFSMGLARVKKGGKYGFIDTSGNLKINCTYDAAANFLDNITSVQVGGFYRLINMREETIEQLPHMYDVVSFNRGIAVLPTPISYTVYRAGGTKIKTDLPYGDNLVSSYVYPFSEDIARFFNHSVQAGFRFGYVLPDGKLLNAYRYQWARDFSNGLAAVKLNGYYGFINPKGEMVIDAIYDDALNFYPVR